MNITHEELFTDVVREVNAVTFAMALMKRETLTALGGLDEFKCPNGFGDALFCNEAKKRGFKTVYTPFAQGVHHETKSRKLFPEELEIVELALAGVPIADLYSDVQAQLQPSRVSLAQIEETAAMKIFQRLIHSPVLNNKAVNTLAQGMLDIGKMTRKNLKK